MTRRRPTDVQIEILEALDNDSLYAAALVSLGALNRRAKRERDKRRSVLRYRGWSRRQDVAEALDGEISTIYRLKTTLLDRLVAAGMADVQRFQYQRPCEVCAGSADVSPYEQRVVVFCDYCAREWVGYPGSECYCCGQIGASETPGRECARCDGRGSYRMETWYVVSCGDYWWHQPEHEATDAMRAVAVNSPAHDPDQPQREIEAPLIEGRKLTIEAQHRAVEIAIDRLSARSQAA